MSLLAVILPVFLPRPPPLPLTHLKKRKRERDREREGGCVRSWSMWQGGERTSHVSGCSEGGIKMEEKKKPERRAGGCSGGRDESN